jgi:hypothetical protein
VATQTVSDSDSLTTSGTEITEGKHYWEVELVSDVLALSSTLSSAPHYWESENVRIAIGVSRPNLDPVGDYGFKDCTNGWFVNAHSGGLFGNGKYNGKEGDDEVGPYKQGDRVGVLLDLDNGSLRFFKNGVQHGPGYAAGSVTGPVVAAVQLYYKDASVRMLPNAEVHLLLEESRGSHEVGLYTRQPGTSVDSTALAHSTSCRIR